MTIFRLDAERLDSLHFDIHRRRLGLLAPLMAFLGLWGILSATYPRLWPALGDEFWRHPLDTPTEAVLAHRAGAVRVRPVSSWIWQDLAPGLQDLVAGDRVYTAEDGVAELQFLSPNFSLQILPNTLIVIGRHLAEGAGAASSIRFHVERGAVRISVPKKTRPFLIEDGNRQVLVQELDDGITFGGPMPTSPIPSLVDPFSAPGELSPADGAIQSAQEAAGALVSFRWSAPPPGFVVSLEIESASEQGIYSPFPGKAQGLRQTGAEARLPVGLYRWRVGYAKPGSPPNPSEWSPYHRLQVLGESPDLNVAVPFIIPPEKTAETGKPARLPAKPKKIRFLRIDALPSLRVIDSIGKSESYKESLLLRWKPVQGAIRYEVRVRRRALGKSTSGPEIHLESREAQVKVDGLAHAETGIYQLRISAAFPEAEHALRRADSGFLPLRLEVAAPSLVTPADGAILEERGFTVLTWARSTFKREAFRVQVATESRFLRPLLDRRGQDNFLKARLPGGARYFWRVKILSEGRESPWSAAREFSVQ